MNECPPITRQQARELAHAFRCVETCIPEPMQVPVLIGLFAQIAGVPTDPNYLKGQAVCGLLPQEQLPVLIGLAQQILLAIQSQGQQKIPPDYIDYPGPPTVTPPAIQHVVVDSVGQQWMYWNSEWQ
jgi:hypothetical protein